MSRKLIALFVWLGLASCPLSLLAAETAPATAAAAGPAAPSPDATGAGGGRIVGGTDASLGAAPYQVEIAFSEDTQPPEWAYTNVEHPWKKSAADDHHCGGSLIARDWVLTAQHCVTDAGGSLLSTSDLVVRGGDIAINGKDGRSLNPNMRVFRIRAGGFIPYPGYRASTDATPPVNDLALVHLATPVPLDPPRVRQKRFATILLASRPYRAGPVLATGWGSVDASAGVGQVQREQAQANLDKQENSAALVPSSAFTAAILKMSPNLQIVTLHVVDNATCADKVQQQINLTRDAATQRNLPFPAQAPSVSLSDDYMCADGGRSAPSSDPRATCQGDSGGPLTALHWIGSQRALVAVVGWAIGCGQAPGVYTRITPAAVDWISKVTGLSKKALTGLSG